MYYICILACSASLLKVHGKVLNAVFDLFNYFRFHRPFLVMIGKIRSLICKVKSIIQNPLFLLKQTCRAG